MLPIISITQRSQEISNLVLVVSSVKSLPDGVFTKPEAEFIRQQNKELKKDLITYQRLENLIFVNVLADSDPQYKKLESCRKAGDKIAAALNAQKASQVVIFDHEGFPEECLALAEGMALGNYQFLKYKTGDKKENSLKRIEIYSEGLKEGYGIRDTGYAIRDVALINTVNEAVYKCRDLINEPVVTLTATAFAKEVQKLGKDCGAKVEILNKSKLEALKMGGILGVNLGSHNPPTFSVMEWKPAGAVNSKPVVIVGKGVMFDTGGMNLKTEGGMANMKDDMSGAAAAALTVYAVAKAKLPVHVIGLMPATDNRPGTQAIVPGDVLTMHSGTTVEIISTDAEGRLLLADALSYARKYKPGLVIDMATLTGAATRAIGRLACAGMQSKASEEMMELMESGFRVNERIVELPLWDEYADMIKSEVADVKNLGPGEAGTITAGKFLQKFTDYPYIHLDIAGPAFLEKSDSYRTQGGTGFGIRMIVDFLSRKA
jgi:leucyl aminopeptidase